MQYIASKCILIGLVAVFSIVINGQQQTLSDEMDEAQAFLEDYSRRLEEMVYQASVVDWNYYTNITDENQELSDEYNVKLALFEKEGAKNCSQFNWRNFTEGPLKKQLKSFCQLGSEALSDEEIAKLEKLVSDMENIYSTGKVCIEKECMEIEPDLVRILGKERDWEKLQMVWQKWRDATGKKIKDKYVQFVELSNKAAKLEGLNNTGDDWRSNYDSKHYDNFEEVVDKLWTQVKPLYQQLHAYMRKKLKQQYQGKEFPKGGHIPAHITGNMWAQSFFKLYDFAKPFPNATTINVTDTMIKKNFTAKDIVQLADNFFVSLGHPPMPQSFWDDSLYAKPSDGRIVDCQASAWDFLNGKDIRLLQCTSVTQEYLEVTHHEMGHLQYFLQYKDLPILFRDGANNGFHEAVGDVAYLSVATPEYLNKIGLLDKLPEGEEADLNFLMSVALERIAFLPFGYLIDQWRWSVFSGKTKPEHYNRDWWKLRCKHQGISPPVARMTDDFDPGAKYHIPGNVPYIRYFIAFILQFQFHQSLCKTANNTRPLHRCDLYQSKAAGKAFGDMMKLGSSVPWPEALKKITGTERMDAQPLVDYFKPLYDWLVKENEGETIGWDENCPEGMVDVQPKKEQPNETKDNNTGSMALRISPNINFVAFVVFMLMKFLM